MIKLENECWKSIKDYEGIYEVSNCGRVKSLERIVYNSGTKNGLYTIHEKIIKQRVNKKDMVIVNYLCIKMVKKNVLRCID